MQQTVTTSTTAAELLVLSPFRSVNSRQYSFPTEHVFPQGRFFDVWRFLMRLPHGACCIYNQLLSNTPSNQKIATDSRILNRKNGFERFKRQVDLVDVSDRLKERSIIELQKGDPKFDRY
jgi:hypothetical protein